MAYFSRMIATRHHNLPTYEKELVVLVKLIKHWWSYPWGHNFIIHTYHYSLKFFLEKGVLSLSQQHWSSKLLGYSFSIEYKVGRLNTVANALSRRDVDNSILMAIYMPHLSILMKFAMSSNILLPCNISSHKFLVAQLLQLGIISKAYSSTRLEFFFLSKDSPSIQTTMTTLHNYGHEGYQKTLFHISICYKFIPIYWIF